MKREESAIMVLSRRVIEHMDVGAEFASIMADVNAHGGNTGHSGFIYYTDTKKFYDKNSEEIWEWLVETAEDRGYKNVFAFLATLHCDNICNETTFKDYIAKLVLENVAWEYRSRL